MNCRSKNMRSVVALLTSFGTALACSAVLYAQNATSEVEAFNSFGSTFGNNGAPGSGPGGGPPPGSGTQPNPSPTPETIEAKFTVAAQGKQIKFDCASCHWLEVHVDNRKLNFEETVTLKKGKAYEVTVKDNPQTSQTPPQGSTPPESDSQTYTVWPIPAGNQTITPIPSENSGDPPKAFLVQKDQILQYLIDNSEGLLAENKPWPKNPSDEPMNKKARLLPVQVITINTFIPHNNVDDPGNMNPFGDDHVFGGDNRLSGTPARATWNKDGSRRTQQRFSVIPFRNMGDADGLEDNAYNDSSPTGPKNSFVLNYVGTTRKYEKSSSLDSSGNLTPAALADTHKADGTLMVGEDTASNSGMKVEPEWLGDRKIKIKCTVSVGNPLAPAVFENEIDYVFDIIIDYTNASATYSLSGKRNKFPAYEIYIGNKRIHEHDPLATGNGLTDLFGRGDPITSVVNALLP